MLSYVIPGGGVDVGGKNNRVFFRYISVQYPQRLSQLFNHSYLLILFGKIFFKLNFIMNPQTLTYFSIRRFFQFRFGIEWLTKNLDMGIGWISEFCLEKLRRIMSEMTVTWKLLEIRV